MNHNGGREVTSTKSKKSSNNLKGSTGFMAGKGKDKKRGDFNF